MRRSLTLSQQSAAAPPGCRGKRPIGSVSCHLHPERSGPSASLLSTSQGSHPELPCGICHSWWSRTSASITLSRALCIRSEALTGCSAREALGVSKDTCRRQTRCGSWGCGFSSVLTKIFFPFGIRNIILFGEENTLFEALWSYLNKNK